MRLNKLFISKLVVLLGLVVLLSPSTIVVKAQTAQDQILQGIDEACSGGACADDGGKIDSTVQTVVNILSLVVGAVAVVMIVVGGLKYVSSQGDSSAVSSAKNTVIYAVVGLIIVAMAQIIVAFVVQRSTDTSSGSGATSPNPTSTTSPGGRDGPR
jgi:lysylphosphatidylglycerol synthetase-like protein (DUF2156 family)